MRFMPFRGAPVAAIVAPWRSLCGRWLGRVWPVQSLAVSMSLFGCVGLNPGVTFQLHDLDRPATLSRINRIGEVPSEANRPARTRPANQACRSEMYFLAYGAYVAVAVDLDLEQTDPKKPARVLGTYSRPEHPVDFRIDRIDLRHTAAFQLYIHEVNEIEIDCDAIQIEKVTDNAP